MKTLAGRYKGMFGAGHLSRPQRIALIPSYGEVAVLQPFAPRPIAIFSHDGSFIRAIGEQVPIFSCSILHAFLSGKLIA